MAELMWGATLGDRIRVARVRARLNQAELARRIGVSTNAMNRMEIGITTDPHASRIKAIAEVLDVSTDYLLGHGTAGTPPNTSPGVATARRRTSPSRRPADKTNGRTPVKVAADPQATRQCPHCLMAMQPLGDGARFTCPGCHHTISGAT